MAKLFSEAPETFYHHTLGPLQGPQRDPDLAQGHSVLHRSNFWEEGSRRGCLGFLFSLVSEPC